MRCKGIVSPEKGRVELTDVEVRDPQPGEILVRVKASLVSPGTERAMILNLDNTPGVYPFEPGYCAAGVVEAVGPGGSPLRVGDRVATFLIGHRQLGTVSASNAVKIADATTFEQAAFTSLGQIALQGVRKARIELGERVLVLGLGIVGQLALQLARLSGAVPGVGVDRVRSRLDTALACGADEVIDASSRDWVDRAGQPPVVIESTGAPDAVGQALQAAGSFGRVSLLGSTRGESSVNFYRDVHRKGVTVIGAHAVRSVPKVESRAGSWTWQDDAACFVRLLERDRLRLAPLTSRVAGWEDAPRLFDEILGWSTDLIGTVIVWD